LNVKIVAASRNQKVKLAHPIRVKKKCHAAIKTVDITADKKHTTVVQYNSKSDTAFSLGPNVIKH
jgi:hypothetical protein